MNETYLIYLLYSDPLDWFKKEMSFNDWLSLSQVSRTMRNFVFNDNSLGLKYCLKTILRIEMLDQPAMIQKSSGQIIFGKFSIDEMKKNRSDCNFGVLGWTLLLRHFFGQMKKICNKQSDFESSIQLFRFDKPYLEKNRKTKFNKIMQNIRIQKKNKKSKIKKYSAVSDSDSDIIEKIYGKPKYCKLHNVVINEMKQYLYEDIENKMDEMKNFSIKNWTPEMKRIVQIMDVPKKYDSPPKFKHFLLYKLIKKDLRSIYINENISKDLVFSPKKPLLQTILSNKNVEKRMKKTKDWYDQHKLIIPKIEYNWAKKLFFIMSLLDSNLSRVEESVKVNEKTIGTISLTFKEKDTKDLIDGIDVHIPKSNCKFVKSETKKNHHKTYSQVVSKSRYEFEYKNLSTVLISTEKKDPLFVITKEGLVWKWNDSETTKKNLLFYELFSDNFETIVEKIGKLTSHCIFCGLPLSTEISIKQGYGETCGKHYDKVVKDFSKQFNSFDIENISKMKEQLKKDDEENNANANPNANPNGKEELNTMDYKQIIKDIEETIENDRRKKRMNQIKKNQNIKSNYQNIADNPYILNNSTNHNNSKEEKKEEMKIEKEEEEEESTI